MSGAYKLSQSAVSPFPFISYNLIIFKACRQRKSSIAQTRPHRLPKVPTDSMFGKVFIHSTVLLLCTIGPTLALLFLIYYFRVDEDSDAVYTSISLGKLLFIASFASTIVTMLHGTIPSLLLGSNLLQELEWSSLLGKPRRCG